jgi:prepilin-type N-terminal cleavage/methylation domain-containing protein
LETIRNSKGYTIIEVIIVLAVSGVILISAMALLHGQQGKTEFTQGMRDIDSKIQVIAKNVTSGISPSSQACSIGADGRPTLSSSTAQASGTNSDCILLGSAIEVTPGKDNLNIYLVLGKSASSSFLDASPTPIMDTQENYPIIGGNTIKWSKTYDFSTPVKNQDSNLVGIYLGNSDSGSAGGMLSMRGYRYDSSKGDTIPGCIEQDSGNSCSDAGIMSPVSKWEICFQSAYDAGSTARLDIYPSSSGITTQLNFNGCT